MMPATPVPCGSISVAFSVLGIDVGIEFVDDDADEVRMRALDTGIDHGDDGAAAACQPLRIGYAEFCQRILQAAVDRGGRLKRPCAPCCRR